LTHHLVAENGAIDNYQILTPSTINASPRDPMGQPGPYEEAVMNTPILEEFDSPDDYKGIDILRTIRSFDPCMPCTTHTMVKDHDLVVTREVNTCGCGVS
jgi:hydrogenase large subunit